MKKVYKMSANVRFKGGTMIAVKGNKHYCKTSKYMLSEKWQQAAVCCHFYLGYIAQMVRASGS